MDKDKIKKMLISMVTSENITAIERLLASLDKISDEELQVKLKNVDITKEFIEKIIENYEKIEENTSNFIPVNEWFCYGRTNDTIHLNIIPTDLREDKYKLGDDVFYQRFKDLLEDFLAKMQVIFLENETGKTLFAVSPIFFIRKLLQLFESLGFDKLTEINPNNENDNMSLEQKNYFMNMFNKYGDYTKKYIIQK